MDQGRRAMNGRESQSRRGKSGRRAKMSRGTRVVSASGQILSGGRAGRLCASANVSGTGIDRTGAGPEARVLHIMVLCNTLDQGNDAFPAALAHAPLFRGLSAADRAFLRSGAALRIVPPRTVLLKQADVPTHLHLVLSGLVKVTRISPTGSQLALTYCGPHEMLGCHALFGAKPQPATATTVNQCTVVSWSAGHIDACSRRDPAILRNALVLVCQYGEDLIERVRELATESAEQRIARAIGRVVAKTTADQSMVSGVLPLSRQDVSELASATLFTVSRILTSWEELCIIRSWRGRIQIMDRGALADIAAGRISGRRTKTREANLS